MGKNSPSYFCDCLTCAQAGVRSGIVVKEKDVFQTNFTDAMSQFVYSFFVPLVMCPEVEAGNFAAVVYSVLLNVDKIVMKMTDTL
jgi:hypothetical protein